MPLQFMLLHPLLAQPEKSLLLQLILLPLHPLSHPPPLHPLPFSSRTPQLIIAIDSSKPNKAAHINFLFFINIPLKRVYSP
jgi:hypothetical protein